MKSPQPILSCDAAKSRMTAGNPSAQSRQETLSLPSAYAALSAFTSGCVAFADIHEMTLAIDYW
jgi:hypothetical protein